MCSSDLKVQVETLHLGYFPVKMARTTLSTPIQNLPLSPVDQEKSAAYTSPQRKAYFLSARAALNAIQPGLQVGLTYPNDIPSLLHGFTSLSHGGDPAVALYHPFLHVGIDVEGPRAQLSRIAQKFLHSEELAFIEGHSQKDWLLRVAWGAKEAVYKAAHVKGLSFSDDIRFVSWPDGDGAFRSEEHTV